MHIKTCLFLRNAPAVVSAKHATTDMLKSDAINDVSIRMASKDGVWKECI
jgi:hypothetical protein